MKNLYFLSAFCFFFLVLNAQPGTLDKSFGNQGKVATLLAGGYDELYKTAIQKDNKIVVAGLLHASTRQLLVIRYLENGLIDSSFGVNGYLFLSDGPSLWSCCLTIQSDGKILVGGTTFFDAFTVLYRFLPNGELDKSFGNDGIVLNDLGGKSGATDIACLSDGKIITGGTFSYFNDETFGFYAFAARFNTNGSLDSSFGIDGKCLFDKNKTGPQALITSMDVGNKGQIVLAGNNGKGISASSKIFVAMITPDGKIDSSFSNDGFTYTDINNDGETAEDVELLVDGKIIVAGASDISGFNGAKAHIALVKYNTDGSYDESFGKQGKVQELVNEQSYGYSMRIQDNNKIIVGGYSVQLNDSYDFVIARFQSTGLLDSSFGINGFAVTDMGDNEKGKSLIIQKDGKIILGGAPNLLTEGKSGILLARYLGDSTHPLITKIKTWIRRHILNFTDNNPNTAYYAIEQQTSSGAYKQIGIVNNETVNVNNTPLGAGVSYSFALPSVPAVLRDQLSSVNYRVKAVNKDGSFSYSNMVADNEPQTTNYKLQTITITPNPATNFITISGLDATKKYEVRILNKEGKEVAKKMASSCSNFKFDIVNLYIGIYFIEAKDSEGNTSSLKFVKQ
jgi:uncharacterized delta-60 repeat protein